MKQSSLLLTLSFLILILNITGCSVARFAETRMGYGIKNANKIKMDLDFQLGFDAIDNSLTVKLERQPYSIYKPQITLNDLGIGLAALGLLGKVFYDNWDHDNTFTFSDDTFDWEDSELWEKAVLIGVPIDILLYWGFSYTFDRHKMKLPKQPLTGHPYRIELPDQAGLSTNYTTISGTERIAIRNFLADLGNPSYLRNVESLKFRVSTEVSGKRYKKDYTVSGLSVPSNSLSQIELESSNRSVQQVQVDANWSRNSVRAGERATLKVRVRNTSSAALTGLTVKTISRNPDFNDWELKFGNIAQGASETRLLRCMTNTNTQQKTVFVTLRFETSSGVVHPDIDKELKITE